MILNNVEIILKSIRPCPLCAMSLRHCTCIGAILYNIRIPCVLQAADVAVGIVYTKV